MKNKDYTKNHMSVPWHDYTISSSGTPVKDATLVEKASLVGRIGSIVLSCGTTAWRTRRAMTKISKTLGIACTVEIGIATIHYTCYEGHESYSQTIVLDNIGVNTDKLYKIEQYIARFSEAGMLTGMEENHLQLDEIEHSPHLYPAPLLALAAAMACAAFMFLLGGGPAEMICVFIAAGCGNLARVLSNKSKMASMIGVVVGAVTACVVYALTMTIARSIFPNIISYGTGFIGSVLFLVPGFPFLTSIQDFGKLDMRSGIEKMAYSLIVMGFATMFCWAAAVIFGLSPAVGDGIVMGPYLKVVIQLIASFIGVIGFSMIFNSPLKMALCAGVVGAIANTLRLVLVEYSGISTIMCSFIGPFCAGILAVFFTKKTGFPRVGITIPAVVVAVPGLFMYRAIYYIGTGDTEAGIAAFFKAAAIVFAIGLGVLFARYLTDSRFRHND